MRHRHTDKGAWSRLSETSREMHATDTRVYENRNGSPAKEPEGEHEELRTWSNKQRDTVPLADAQIRQPLRAGVA